MKSRASASAAKERWAGTGINKRNILIAVIIVAGLFAPAGAVVADVKDRDTREEIPEQAVSKKILENGLVILAKEMKYTDLVAINVKVRAGSCDEGSLTGSGLAHLVEHMVFKGTTFNSSDQIEAKIKSYGAVTNGAVSNDYTEFTMTVPVKNFAPAVALLKDLLLNAKFDEKDLIKEKEVIANEMRLKKDEPQTLLLWALDDTAYMYHSYKYPVIGLQEAFKRLQREDAVHYYEKMYRPNRMVIAVAGGISQEDAISITSREWSSFRAPNYEANYIPVEPTQIIKKTDTIEIPNSLAYIAMGYHSTSVTDDDLFAMDVLSMILGRGDNSRLVKVLKKEKELVYNISSWNYTPRDPGLFIISAILSPGMIEKSEQEIDRIIGDIKKSGINEAELETAKRMVASDYIFSLEPIEAQANDLANAYLLTGTYEFSRRYVEGVRAVTASDVKRVAVKYLTDGNLSVIRLVPKGYLKAKRAKTEAVPSESRLEKLDNGIRVVVRRKTETPSVSINISFLGGVMAEDEKRPGLSNFTAQMLLKGLHNRNEDEIRGYIESRGGSIYGVSALSSFGIHVDVLSRDLAGAFEVLRDIVSEPTFPVDEIKKEKLLVLAMIKEADDDIYGRGINMLRGELFKGSPYANRILGTTESVDAIGQDDLVAFYKKTCVPQRMVIAISGDVDINKTMGDVKKMFGGVKVNASEIPVAKPAKLDSVKVVTAEMEREEALILIGFDGVSAGDPDRYALEVLSSAMSGIYGRLYDVLRNKENLSYSLGCVPRFAYNAGFLVFYVATSKGRMDEAKSLLTETIKEIQSKDVGDKELDDAKKAMITEYKIGMQMNSYFAMNAASAELDGIGYESVLKYPERINAVSKDDLKRVAKKYLDMARCVEILISPKWR